MQLRFVSEFNKKKDASPIAAVDVSTIGIAGVKLPGFVDYMRKVRSVTTAHFTQHTHPNIIQIQPAVNPAIGISEQKRLEMLENHLVDAVKTLAEAGANFVIIPDDTLHNHIKNVRKRAPHISVISTGDVVPRACMQQGFVKIGIMGNPLVMANDKYREEFAYTGIHAIVPDQNDQALIQDALTVLSLTPAKTIHQETLNDLIAVAARLKEEGCDAIVVACPILSKLLNKKMCGLPVLDTTLILAGVAVQKAEEFLQQKKMSSSRVNGLRAAL